MDTYQLWGVLILAAQNRHTLTEAQLQQILGSSSLEVSLALTEVSRYCEINNMPALDSVVQQSGSPPPESIWRYNWAAQDVPPDEPDLADHSPAFDHSPDWYSEAVQTLRKGSDAARDAASTLVAAHWPTIEKALREKVQPSIADFASDDDRIRQIARLVYPLLPSVLQLLVREEDFVQICLKNRDRVLRMHSSGATKRP